MSVNVSAYLTRAASASEAGEFKEAFKAVSHVAAAQAEQIAELQRQLKREHGRINRILNSLVRAGVEVL